MSVLETLTEALRVGAVEVRDLTAPLSEDTPIIELPPERGQPWPLSRELISRYDARGELVYWNNLRLSEHTGTHFDAPVHWLPGRDLDDVSQVPPGRLVGPAVVVDASEQVERDPDFLLHEDDVQRWIARHGPLPEGGWLLYRTGWERRAADPVAFANGGHWPGLAPSCAKWLADQPILGIGVETIGTDAGQAGTFGEQAFPCHWHFQGSGKYGLTQLRNLSTMPTRGAVVVAGPLPIVGGSGSPSRVLAFVEVA